MRTVRVDQLFGTEFASDKAHGLEYGDSPSNHAMTLTGVNLDEDGKPNRWKVENSWGKDNGKDGYYVASDAWFDRYVHRAHHPQGIPRRAHARRGGFRTGDPAALAADLQGLPLSGAYPLCQRDHPQSAFGWQPPPAIGGFLHAPDSGGCRMAGWGGWSNIVHTYKNPP